MATHKGNFKKEFGIDVECYVLNDGNKTAVISQSGMGSALGLGEGGSRLPRLINRKSLSKYIGPELREKLEKPIIFQTGTAGLNNTIAYGYDVANLIDICRAIIAADQDEGLHRSQVKLVNQAHIIISASAKAGIQGLVYALAGYKPEVEEVIQAFKKFVQEEAKKYEKEFPTELYAEWQRLYDITPPTRGKNWKEMHLTVDHIYTPLAKSNGKLLDLLRSAKLSDGNRSKKLFQFLNEVGTRALRMHLGRVLEMAESSPNKHAYEAKIAERFGGQLTLEMSPPNQKDSE